MRRLLWCVLHRGFSGKYFGMKYVMLGMAVWLIFSSAQEVLAAEVNLISNASVETAVGRLPADWVHTKKGNNISVFTHATTGYTGSRSLLIKVTQYVAGESYWSFTPVLVTPGSEYVYGEYYKSTMATKLYARVVRTDGSELVIALAEPVPTSTWTKLSIPVLVPLDARSVTIVHAAVGLGTLQIDDASLVQQGVVDPNPPVATSTPTSTPPVATSTPTSTPPVTTGNPIPNPSVEIVSANPAVPLSWRSVKTGNNNARFTYLQSGRTGGRSLQVEIGRHTSGVAYYRFDPVAVTGGKTYDLSFYHKSDTYAEIDAEITLTTGEVVYQYLGVSFPSTDWSRFAARIRLPENAQTVTMYSLLYSKGKLITDDYALVPVTVVPLDRALVSLTFDDFFNSMYDTVFPMFKSHDFKGTMYLTTKDLGAPDTMSPEKLREMHDYGFEVGAHTVTHAHLPFLTPQQVEYELAQSKSDISSFAGITAKNFATPYGEYNDPIKQQIGALYRSHRSVDVGYNTKDNFDILNIKAMSATNLTTPETVLGWVDDAIRDKAWLVVVYHDIVDGGGTWTNTPAHMQTVVDGLANRGVPVVSVESALNEVVPQI